MKKIKQLVSSLLLVCMLVGIATPVFAVQDDSKEIVDSLTVSFDSRSRMTNRAQFESEEVKSFFEKNEMNYEFYKNWLYENGIDQISSVTFSVCENNDVAPASNNNTILGNRIVNVSTIRTYNEEFTHQFPTGTLLTNALSVGVEYAFPKFTKFLEPVAVLLDLTDDLDSLFGQQYVEAGSDYLDFHQGMRRVSRFVELYAPVSGVNQWYAWGYSESEYYATTLMLVVDGDILPGIDGLPDAYKFYDQIYPENFYNETTLTNLVKQAYLNGTTYTESAGGYIGGNTNYDIYLRGITHDIYHYEFD